MVHSPRANERKGKKCNSKNCIANEDTRLHRIGIITKGVESDRSETKGFVVRYCGIVESIQRYMKAHYISVSGECSREVTYNIRYNKD